MVQWSSDSVLDYQPLIPGSIPKSEVRFILHLITKQFSHIALVLYCKTEGVKDLFYQLCAVQTALDMDIPI